MNRFNAPEMEIVKFDAADVVATSTYSTIYTPGVSLPQNVGENVVPTVVDGQQ